jgi:hypothetical protein
MALQLAYYRDQVTTAYLSRWLQLSGSTLMSLSALQLAYLRDPVVLNSSMIPDSCGVDPDGAGVHAYVPVSAAANRLVRSRLMSSS